MREKAKTVERLEKQIKDDKLQASKIRRDASKSPKTPELRATKTELAKLQNQHYLIVAENTKLKNKMSAVQQVEKLKAEV